MEEQTINNQRRENGNRPDRRNNRRGREDQRKGNFTHTNQNKVNDNNDVVKEQPKSEVADNQRHGDNKLFGNANNGANRRGNNNGNGNNRPAGNVSQNGEKGRNNGNGRDAVAKTPNNEAVNANNSNQGGRDRRTNNQPSDQQRRLFNDRERVGDRGARQESQPVSMPREVVNVRKENQPLKVGITHGDYNGVNYEILLNGLFNKAILDICKPIVYGHAKIASEFKKRMGISEYGFSFVKGVEQATKNELYLVNISEKDYAINLGQVSKEAGELAFLALERAVADIKAKKIDVIVTAPINKNSINQTPEFDFPGHTEYLADRFGADKTLMLMVADNLRVAVATNHVPVDKLNKVITKELIIDKVNALNQSLKRDFAIDMPKIAVLSLNPHCGDGGVIGTEELDVILPAVEELREGGLIVNGPFAADGFFSSSAIYGKYDAVLAMYHDQGMIPFKMIAGDCGVNFTAGLPIVRTSPAHGTAFDIAGQNSASHSMLLEAIIMACNIHRNRKEYDELTANRLK